MSASETKWLRFEHVGNSESGKTSRWSVLSRTQGSLLGSLQWFPRWRQYTFDPADGTTFNAECLKDVAEFLLDANARHRKADHAE